MGAVVIYRPRWLRGQLCVSAQMPTAKQISAITRTGTVTFGGGPGCMRETGTDWVGTCEG